MTDNDTNVHDMILMRNPWGITTYKGDWNENDPRWTDELVAQVPYEVDPRIHADEDGLFVMPKRYLETELGCFSGIDVIHYRENYVDTWYDVVDSYDNITNYFYFTIPPDAIREDNKDAIYVTSETYFYEIIPGLCTFEPNTPNPILYLFIYKKNIEGNWDIYGEL